MLPTFGVLIAQARPGRASGTSTGPCWCTPSCRPSNWAPAAAGGGDGATTADRDRHLRQGVRGAGGDRERGRGRGRRGAAGYVAEQRLHPRRGRVRRRARRRRAGERPDRGPDLEVVEPTGPEQALSTGCPGTGTRCTSTPSSPPGAASACRSCTGCAPSAWLAGRCCRCCVTGTRRGSGRCRGDSAVRFGRVSR